MCAVWAVVGGVGGEGGGGDVGGGGGGGAGGERACIGGPFMLLVLRNYKQWCCGQ